MKKFIKLLDGKKTIIGLILSAIVGYLKMAGYIDANLATLLGTITGLIFAGGVGHKVQKAIKKNQ